MTTPAAADESLISVNGEAEVELREWLESLDYILAHRRPEQVQDLLLRLHARARKAGVSLPATSQTPYVNTIPRSQQPPYPGSREIERRIKSLIRWNAMAMVVRANRDPASPGGHISTYASSATLYEVGYNHFFRAPTQDFSGDLVYFQGHATPGIYARAFLEGRLGERHLANFRRELREGGGLSSYPHPWLMPDFWQFPTVSMGLGPILSIYQARFNRYLEDRGLKAEDDARVWGFFGDGEMDEPESLGAITLALRERLDNLIWVVNCNLQRLDGPVRGNGKIIQELEGAFRGAGWNVIKVLWGDDWDPLLEKDEEGLLAQRMAEVVDGEFQKYTVSDGAYIRRHFFGADERLARLVDHLSDEQLQKMRRGGHDPEKVYAAFRAAVEHKGSPTVILAKTIKGYGLGEAGEGKNMTHQQKKLNEEELREFRTRFGIPIDDDAVAEAPFYKPPPESEEIRYLEERRRALGGHLPQRSVRARPLPMPSPALFQEFRGGSEGRAMATTMAFGRLLTRLLRDREVGSLVVPIIPDEARTFGLDSLFRPFGIYSHCGQLYEPVDREMVSYYKEAADGQILEEGINEAGSMSSFIAAGTAYATHGINTIPFFVYYSMFGLQRIGDLIWLAGDMRCKGSSWAAPRGARPWPARACSTTTATPTCSPTRFPTSSPTTRPSPTRSRSSSRTASGACTRSRRTCSTTSRWRTTPTPCRPCPRASRKGCSRGCTACARRRGSGGSGPSSSGPGRSSTWPWRRRRSSTSATAWPRTCGASPASRTCTSTAWPPSAGTACTRDASGASPTWSNA